MGHVMLDDGGVFHHIQGILMQLESKSNTFCGRMKVIGDQLSVSPVRSTHPDLFLVNSLRTPLSLSTCELPPSVSLGGNFVLLQAGL